MAITAMVLRQDRRSAIAKNCRLSVSQSVNLHQCQPPRAVGHLAAFGLLLRSSEEVVYICPVCLCMKTRGIPHAWTLYAENKLNDDFACTLA
jgi:hypothetical protein